VIAYIGKLKPTSRNLLKGISDHFVQCLRGLLLGDEAATAIIVGKRVHLTATVHVIEGKTATHWSVHPRVGTTTQGQNVSSDVIGEEPWAKGLPEPSCLRFGF
jgi:hypothetical protein